ncbi:DUF2690 domain-containing protein [Streptomyces sp. NPDC050842]|uniref:DUF2690 domain-containing protein n=1 Tax=Streptomyces sp. NPDC050842 TaxID=3365636 RepID=UPI00379032E8
MPLRRGEAGRPGALTPSRSTRPTPGATRRRGSAVSRAPYEAGAAPVARDLPGVRTVRTADRGVELRYSPTCRAAWARKTSGASFDTVIRVHTPKGPHRVFITGATGRRTPRWSMTRTSSPGRARCVPTRPSRPTAPAVTKDERP